MFAKAPLGLRGGGLVELRLELTLVTNKDGALLSSLLSRCPHTLTKLALHLINSTKEGLSGFGLNTAPNSLPKALKTLGLRMDVRGGTVRTRFPFFNSIFPSIKIG